MNGYDPVLGDLDLEALCAEEQIDAATARIEAERESVCPTCDGDGVVFEDDVQGSFTISRLVTCPTCHGTGRG